MIAFFDAKIDIISGPAKGIFLESKNYFSPYIFANLDFQFQPSYLRYPKNGVFKFFRSMPGRSSGPYTKAEAPQPGTPA